eukprot:Nk52_evm1s2082 gene=Nk52_evmTU1s2082
MLDGTSRLLESEFIVEKRGYKVADIIFHKWICKYGIPSLIICDNDTTFRNELMERLTQYLQIEMHFSVPNIAKGHGRIERVHRELNEQLRKIVLTH